MDGGFGEKCDLYGSFNPVKARLQAILALKQQRQLPGAQGTIKGFRFDVAGKSRKSAGGDGFRKAKGGN